MSHKTQEIVRRITKSMDSSNSRRTNPYDTTATVMKVENGIAYIRIPGGEDETPVKLTINAKPGDQVQVRVKNNGSFIMGNATAPPTDDTQANVAVDTANTAGYIAIGARQEAEIASSMAENAIQSAATAAQAAEDAQTSATEAGQAATSAKNSADTALTQLSIVEDVSGTLNWIREHGQYVATTDTAVNPDTVYFVLQGGDYVPIANPDPTANPSEQGWYILDVTDSQSDYIMAHLAVTSAGLWVLPSGQFTANELVDSSGDPVVDSDGNAITTWSSDPQAANGYKVLLSASGMTVFDGSGTAVATYGESIYFSSSRPQRIGGEQVYIEYYDSNNDGTPDSLNIVGASISLNNGRDVASSLDNLNGEIYGSGAGSEGLRDQFNRIEGDVTELSDSYLLMARDINGFMTFGTSEGNPTLTLGADGSDFKSEFTNKRLRFLYLGTELAYLTGTSLHVSEQLSFGNFILYQRENGHFTIKYIGDEN